MSFLHLDYTWTVTELVLGMVPGGRPLKMGFGDWFCDALHLEYNAKLVANGGKKDASNPWNTAASQLIKVRTVVDR